MRNRATAGRLADPGVAVALGRLQRGDGVLGLFAKRPSPIAALWRTSSALSLRASISAGMTLAASPFRCGKRRTAMIRSLS